MIRRSAALRSVMYALAECNKNERCGFRASDHIARVHRPQTDWRAVEVENRGRVPRCTREKPTTVIRTRLPLAHTNPMSICSGIMMSMLNMKSLSQCSWWVINAFVHLWIMGIINLLYLLLGPASFSFFIDNMILLKRNYVKTLNWTQVSLKCAIQRIIYKMFI